MRKHFIVGLITVAVLAVVNVLFEGNWFEREIARMTYRLQQLRLAESGNQDGLPVVVVDVSALPREPRTDDRGHVDMVTDRARLLAIIAAVAEPARGAKAVGLDILLDPPSGGTPTESERALLDFALAGGRPQSGPPIFVAVSNDGFVRGQGAWLGDPKYASIAAMSAVPAFEDSHPFQMVPRVVWHAPDTTDEHSILPTSCDHLPAPCLESLAQRLAHAGTSEERGGRFAKWLIRWSPLAVLYQNHAAKFGEGSPLHGVVFPINFGPVPALQSNKIEASSEVDVASLDLKDKYVLIGRGTLGNAEDTFDAAVLNEPLPGVYLHAAATVTLLEAPVFLLTKPGAIVVDLLVGAFAVAAAMLLQHTLHRRLRKDSRLVTYAVALSMAAIVFLIGFFGFTWTGILWTQCLPVIAALVLHPSAERLFEAPLERLWQARPRRGRQTKHRQARLAK